MVEQQAKEKYLRIIKQLERPYEEKASDEQIYGSFKTRVSKQFKLQVTCDSALQVALHQYYKDVHKTFFSTQSFGPKLKFIQKINQVFRSFQFISRRQYTKLNDNIVKQLNNPANKWLQNIVYLKNSQSVSQFRYQFLSKYCSVAEDDVEEIAQNDSDQNLKTIKNYYQNFFTHCLEIGVNPKIINFIQDYFSQFENKSQMLPAKLLKQLQSTLGISEIGSDQKEIMINQRLRNLAQQNAYNNDQQAQQRLQDEIKLLEKALKKFSGLNIFKQKKITLTLGKFGSLTSGFAGVDADLDLTILTNCYINQIQLLRLLYEFLRKQYKGDDNNRGARRISLDFIQHAKTPLLQVIINERGKQTVKIDIIVNNILGIINSKFLSVYASVKWIKNLGILVKMWGKSQNLIGKNYLSSYAMILMLIHYLIKVKKAKPILDNRVITSEKPYFDYKRLKLSEVQKFKVFYVFKKEFKDVSSIQRENYYKILLGFTHYYAYQLWEEKDENKRIITVDQSIDREVDKETVITIKDPFDQPHNPGRMKLDAKDFFIQKFKDAHTILKNGDPLKIAQLFAGK